MDLENDETKGFDNYPKSVVDAYDLMIRYRTPKRAPFNRNNANESMSFVNKGSIDKSKVECYSCHQMDHYANVCPKKQGRTSNGIQAVTFGEVENIEDDDVFIGDFSYLQFEDTEENDTNPTEANSDSTSNEINEEQRNSVIHTGTFLDTLIFGSDDEDPGPWGESDEEDVESIDSFDDCSEDGYSDSSSSECSLGRPLYATGSLINKIRMPRKFYNRRIFVFGTMLVIRLKSGGPYHVGDLHPPSLIGTTLTQHIKHKTINKNWILLDSQSTIDLFCNRQLLDNIRSTQRTMRVRGTGGVESTNLIGDLPGYGPVWFKEDGLANILSLVRVSKIYQVTYDSSNGNCFTVHRPMTHDLHFC